MNLETNYLGLKLKNPLIVSACRLSERIENIKAMEDAGAAAVVMYSIFEEEINYNEAFVDYYMKHGTEKFAESLTYFPHIDQQASFLDKHLFHLEKAVNAVKIPIIGSLNAVSHEGWLNYAVKMQETGISALELNFYRLPVNKETSEMIESNYLTIAQELKSILKIPLAIKLGPYFTSIINMATTLDKIANIDGLVIFNRFYHPDYDIEKMDFKTDIELSHSFEALLPLQWISILRDQIKASIAGSTGIQTSSDAIKFLLAGCDAVMMASCLIKNKIGYLSQLLSGINDWLTRKNFESIKEIQGLMSKMKAAHLIELTRAQYMKALRSFESETY